MKGTLFSTDYVFDSAGNPRLVELNTDTGVTNGALSHHLDCTSFINVLSGSSISDVHIIYKGFQQNFVTWLNDQLTISASFVTNIEHHIEDTDTIYPISIPDDSSSFILRLAYDENAILDSTYAKSKSNLHKLFTEYTSSADTVEYYYTGSDGEFDTISTSSYLNGDDSELPDFVIKTKTEISEPVVFTKVGLNTSSSLERYTQFKNGINESTHYFEKFHYNPTDISGSDRFLSSIRSFDIIYGTSLDILNIGMYKTETVVDVPTSASLAEENFYDNSRIRNDYATHHAHAFSTKFMVGDFNGIYSDTILVGTGSDNFVSASELVVNDNIQSFFVSGTQLDSAEYDFLQVFWTGSVMASGSYTSSSLVEAITTGSDRFNSIGEIVLDNGQRIYCGNTKYFLAYNTSSNESKYVAQFDMNHDTYLYDISGGLHHVSQSNQVLLKSTPTLYKIDVEDVDTMVISGSNLIVHNAPCFVAGTPVRTEFGISNIEDIVPGDKVITWNHEENKAEFCVVVDTTEKENQLTVTYVFENGVELTGTPDHPLYVTDKGYASYYPKQTLDDSGLKVEQILIGDEVQHIDGYSVPIIDIIENEEPVSVYNLSNVAKNHNFFVEDFLAHNRSPLTCFAAGTEISLSNGDVKNIEDIIIGDEVLGWDGESIVPAEVISIDHQHTVGAHKRGCELLGDEPSLYTINDTGIEFTPEHPFLTKEGWKSLTPYVDQEPYKSQQEPKNLVIGDLINVNGEWIEITSIRKVRSDADESVYNITVDKVHSYIANGIIVHNK